MYNTGYYYLLQHRYEIILSPNYFITVVYYYCTHPILFLCFFIDPYFFTFFMYVTVKLIVLVLLSHSIYQPQEVTLGMRKLIFSKNKIK